MSEQSSRERLSSALACGKPEYVPCCFMLFQALRQECRDDFEFFDRQLELGLDVRVELPDLPMYFDPRVSVRTWKEHPPEEPYPLLYKEYVTPSGVLRTAVRKTADWPYGDQIPLFDDFIAPRARKFLIERPEDLAGLRHLLTPPGDEDIRAFQGSVARYREYARGRGLLLSGGWRDYPSQDVVVFGRQSGGTAGIDALMWLCGAVAPLEWAYEKPDFLAELIDLIARWTRRRLEIVLDVGVDLIVKRAWYEGTELWSPQLYRRFIAPVLREDIALVHEAGARFGYINTSGTWPIFGDLLELGVDALIGIDPVQGLGTDLAAFAERAGGRMCLWGGVNAPFTIEQSDTTPGAIWKAVEEAITVCGPQGGFILSPVDNLLDPSPQARRNVIEFIRAWQHLRGIP